MIEFHEREACVGDKKKHFHLGCEVDRLKFNIRYRPDFLEG